MEVVERLGSSRTSRSRSADRRRSAWAERLGRAGLVGRGLLYVVIGWLATRLAFGDRSAPADQSGALQAVVRQPFGRLLVLVLAVLFAAYALYRLVLAVFNPEDDGLAKRVWCGWRAVFYGFLTVAALTVAMRPRSPSGHKERDLTVRALELPGGRWFVVIVGAVLIGSGLWHGWRVVTGKFADDLKHDEMPDGVEHTVHTVGVVGSLARMVSFALVGAFLVRVGWMFDPSSPVGLDESLAKVRDASWGQAALVAVGVGLIAFGLFALARSRYQRILSG